MNVGIALLGCGTVGGGVARLLFERRASIERQGGAHYRVGAIVVRDASRARDPAIPRELITDDAARALDDASIHIVIESVGGVGVARAYVERALRAGKHVVTANKDLLALHGPELHALADDRGVSLHYEAAVGGAIPIVRALADSLAGEEVLEVGGVLNGTTNYILSEMGTGRSYDAVLLEAQRRGFAEADPSADVDGHDAAHKLAILAQLAFNLGLTSDRIVRTGIARVTRADVTTAGRIGTRLKLIASARVTPSGLEAVVTPAYVRMNHPYAEPVGSQNCIRVVGRSSGSLTFAGSGAGSAPTASAVVGDIIAALRRIAAPRDLALPPLDAVVSAPRVPAMRGVVSLCSFGDIRPAQRALEASGIACSASGEVPVIFTAPIAVDALTPIVTEALGIEAGRLASVLPLWEDAV